MKTREQIISNIADTFNIDTYVNECTEGLNDEVKDGGNSYECIIDNVHTSIKEDKILAKELAEKLVSLGFHAKYGCRETTPSGNERAIVVVSINKFENTEEDLSTQAFIVGILVALVFLFSYIFSIL